MILYTKGKTKMIQIISNNSLQVFDTVEQKKKIEYNLND